MQMLPVGGEGKEIDVTKNATHELAEGNYELKALDAKAKRKPWPNRVTVKSGETQKIALCLVGEVRAYKGHSGAVTGVQIPLPQNRWGPGVVIPVF